MQLRTLAIELRDPREAELHQLLGGQGPGVERPVDVGDSRRVQVDRPGGECRGERQDGDSSQNCAQTANVHPHHFLERLVVEKGTGAAIVVSANEPGRLV